MIRRSAIAGLLAVAVAAVTGCADPEPLLLDEPTIVFLGSEPSALTPPGTVTATAKVFDPQFRRPTLRWYLSLNPLVTRIDAINQDLSDPDALTGGTPFIYMGAGTRITAAVPPIPADLLPEDNQFDSVPATLILSAKFGTEEIKGIEQVRLVIPELVERVLARQLDRQPTAQEVTDAIRIRLNRNPEIRELLFSVVPGEGGYTAEDAMDLKLRREMVSTPVTAAAGFGPEQGLRVRPVVNDPDLALDVPPGEPGYNNPEGRLLATAGQFFPITLTGFDWVPAEFEAAGTFGDPSLDRSRPPLVMAQYTLFDLQGGSANVGFELDAGNPPRPSHRGNAGSVLLQEGRRMLWLRLAAADILPARAVGAGPWELDLRVSYSTTLPHGVTADLVAARPATAATAPTNLLERLDANPFLRHTMNDTLITVRGRVLRRWSP